MSNDDAADIKWLREQDRAQVFPRLAGIDRRHSRDPWSVKKFEEAIQVKDTHVMMAKNGEEILGYMMYRVKDSQVHLLKLEVEKGYDQYGIRELLYKKLVDKVRPDGMERVVIYVRENDVETQVMLRDRFKFTANKKQPVIRDYFDNGESAYVLQYELKEPGTGLIPYQSGNSILVGPGIEMPPDPAAATPDGEEEAPRREDRFARLSRAEILRRMCRKLQELTGGMEWQVVRKQEGGKWSPASIPDALQDDREYGFRTAGSVRDPKAAYEALRRFFAPPKGGTAHLSSLNRAAPVAFPASWVRQIHLQFGFPGQMEAAFVPSDPQARPEKRKPGEDRGEEGRQVG